ncbi:Siderophore staphylobactin biosynthesis protein SbnI [Staphylococcus aureus]|nr:Siderophore staphylobactin biosynthesis protein SbnI [Staphylococcus aureus]
MNHIHEHLKLVPVDKIDLHETFEPLRLEKTKSSIEADDFIRHPILVTAMQHGRYMVIDGVHRYTSLKALGCKKVPVQESMKHNIQLVRGNIKFHLVCGGKRYNKNIACHGLLRQDKKRHLLRCVMGIQNNICIQKI